MPSTPTVGDELAGYRLRAVLGRGGMSVVYQAENPRLGIIVALKVLAPELAADDVFRTRFLHESRIAASLNHPNVIPVYDTGSCGELLFISMRYVAGADLKTVLAHTRLAPDQSLLLISQAGRALDAAHRSGLVHRDVKPANILIERGADDEPDHVYLADFGITKHTLSRSGLTATGQFVGTIDYIAPEQIQGKPVDGRTDIYSLGCVLYECLTGRVPFQKDLDAAVIWAHVEELPMAPSTVRPELPGAIDDVIVRALAKDPADRYQTCREFMGAARGALEPAPQGTGKTGSDSSSATDPQTVLAGRSAPPLTPDVPAMGTPSGASSGSQAGLSVPAPSFAETATGGRGRGGLDEVSVSQSPSGDSPPTRSRGWRAPRLLVPAGVIILAIAAAIVFLTSSRGGSSMPSSRAGAASAPAGTPILQALVGTNESPTAKGFLPPSSCKAQSLSMVTCSRPSMGISTVSFRTFSSLDALYTAYVAAIRSLAQTPFRANFGDCTRTRVDGEVSWNHNFQHPRGYSLPQSRSGRLTDDQAAGRVYCTFSNSQLNLVWTQKDGRLLGILAGAPHESAWDWWHGVHHSITLPSSSASMQMSSSSHS